MGQIVPRYYQAEAVQAIYDHFARSSENTIVALPTAAGKSVVIGDFIRRACTDYPATRILKLTHRKELIGQNYAKLMNMWPQAPAGIYSAGLKRREINAQVLFAGVQSLAHVQPFVIGHVDIIIIDECHLVPFNEGTQYRQLIAGLVDINPKLKVIGLTATPFRLDSGLLIESGVFTNICYDRTSAEEFNQLVEDGFLCKLVTKRTATELDVSDVKKRAGEFVPGELEAAVDKAPITASALDEVIHYGEDRKAWLLFATGIKHAEHINDYLVYRGIRSCVLHSKIEGDRDKLIADFQAGRYQALVNVDILTTGFDHPGIDLIAMLRPTASPVLHVQTIGRGLRIDPGKKNCLILDFAGNTMRLGPINNVNVTPKQSGKGQKKKEREATGEFMAKACDACDSIHPADTIVCPDCGTEFPLGLSKTAAEVEIVVQGPSTADIPVIDVNYQLHEKPGKPTSMKVTYMAGLTTYREWICLEHDGYPFHKAQRWWLNHGMPLPIPSTQEALDAALAGKIPMPSSIKVTGLHDKYPEIKGYNYQELP